jgi:phospholipase/carboxylesterase
LQSLGYPVQWREYPMPHSVCPQEIADIATFLAEVL